MIAPMAPAELGPPAPLDRGLNRFHRRSDPESTAILIDHMETAVMRNTSEIFCRAMVFSLLGTLLASHQAHAKPVVYSKTLTFTLSTTTPAPPTTRPGTQVAVEPLEIVHEGFRAAKQKPRANR